MVSLVLFDDVRKHNELLETQLTQLVDENGLDARVVFAATDAKSILEYALMHPVGNVYFLDIELQEQFTGVDVCNQLHELDPKAYMVYVSAYPHYAMECVKSHAFDFLLKPFTRTELCDCLTAVLRDMEVRATSKQLTVPLGSRTILLDQGDIRYLTTRRNFIVAHTAQGEYTWRASLAATLDELEEGTFKKINRGCVVNVNHVRAANWTEDALIMGDGEELSVSRRMREALRNRLKIGG